MTVTLSQLLTTRTVAQIKADLIATLQSEGVATSDWSVTAIERAFVELESVALNDLVAGTIPAMAAGGYLSTATGAWLTLLASEFYDIERTAAVSTIGTVTLTCAATAGPYTIVANQLWFQATVGGEVFRYYNTTGGVLAAAGTLAVTVTAETAGDDYTVAANTITTMLTPLPGVTCTNSAGTFSSVTHTGGGSGTATPSGTVAAASWVVVITTSGTLGTAVFKVSKNGGVTFYATGITIGGGGVYGPDAEGLVVTFANPGAVATPFIATDEYAFTSPGTWYTTEGAAAESDALLSARCENRWPALGNFAVRDAYELMAAEASASVGRVRVVTDPSVAATVRIYIAGSSGVVSAVTEAAVQAYVDERSGLTDLVYVDPAVARVITLGGATVRVKAENYQAAVNAAQANVQDYIDQVAISDGATYVRISQIIEAILRESGSEDDSVIGLTLNGAGTDLLLVANEVATWGQTITAALSWVTY